LPKKIKIKIGAATLVAFFKTLAVHKINQSLPSKLLQNILRSDNF